MAQNAIDTTSNDHQSVSQSVKAQQCNTNYGMVWCMYRTERLTSNEEESPQFFVRRVEERVRVRRCHPRGRHRRSAPTGRRGLVEERVAPPAGSSGPSGNVEVIARDGRRVLQCYAQSLS